MSLLHKLILGTAGLGGAPYGRQKRIVARSDAIGLIRHANDCGILVYDTAPVYGDAERVLADALKDREGFVFTKNDGDRTAAVDSLVHFARPDRVTFLVHNYKRQPMPEWCQGATVYAADGNYPELDGMIVQSDWNLLQQRQPTAKAKLFIARSVFLQGVLTSTMDELPNEGLAYGVDNCKRVASMLGVSMEHLALRAALQHPGIQKVLIGPTTIDELDMCCEIALAKSLPLSDALVSIMHCPTKGTDPRTWA